MNELDKNTAEAEETEADSTENIAENSTENNESNDKKKNETKLPFSYDAVGVICSAVTVIMILFTFVFRFVGVNGPSMQPTLYDGDWLIVTAIKPHFEYGDIIISTQPNILNEPIVKRVIATGGQKVDIDFSTGSVYVDGKLLEEKYIMGNTTGSEGFSGSAVVPEGKLFVMGDNRQNSTDSRSEIIGFIDERYIVGKAKMRVFPTQNFTTFE